MADNKEPKSSTMADEEDSGITLIDVLEEEDQLEENANAVLGGSDDQNCTYALVMRFYYYIEFYLVHTNHFRQRAMLKGKHCMLARLVLSTQAKKTCLLDYV